ncbi:Crp/Fnr family transcriptional regulator [Streptomyces javensis]|uniref:Crp/Fnr family transcriptional regulator n=1 Tax=Streptomyces javensis TaxID=114698 RepID=A0ABS0R4I7_9ACTN|nr:helix-turn-helix domain-containing protein [Streptomyces javensis]MBI0312010.1 Crp/Fnr family transcriptional regulator [Streptomyces javensis]
MLRHAEDLFKEHALSEDVVRAVAERMMARHFTRDKVCFTVRRRGGRIFFLRQGCIREELPTGEVRLWRSDTMFGEWTASKRGFYGANGILLSTAGTGLSIPVMDVRQLAREHPDLLTALAAMGAERYHLTESLYGVSRRSPTSRVANLLLYLSAGTTNAIYHVRDERGQMVVQHAPGGLVEGPTQADLADALALGRATVEKILATLRERKALMKSMPGGRTNRFYEIEDRDALMEIARGA